MHTYIYIFIVPFRINLTDIRDLLYLEALLCLQPRLRSITVARTRVGAVSGKRVLAFWVPSAGGK